MLVLLWWLSVLLVLEDMYCGNTLDHYQNSAVLVFLKYVCLDIML